MFGGSTHYTECTVDLGLFQCKKVNMEIILDIYSNRVIVEGKELSVFNLIINSLFMFTDFSYLL